ncbi:hypothetical protein JCM11641_000462 [Rhodosporidiobolus odoratus]
MSIPPALLLFSGLQRLAVSTLRLAQVGVFILVLHSVDLILFLLNFMTPSKRYLAVTPHGFSPTRPPPFAERPVVWLLCAIARRLGEKRSPDWLWAWTHWQGIGARGAWGDSHLEQGASRSPCPALNALANHGVLPRDGCHITPFQMSVAIQYSYNLAPTLAIQLMAPFEPLWRDRGWFDLADLGAEGLVQHDGSFSREDVSSPWAKATTAATQGEPSQRLLNLYFPEEFEGKLSWQNHAKVQAHVRATARATNPQFVFNPLHHVFSAGNSALTHRVVGPYNNHLRTWLGASEKGYEEMPSGFESGTKDAWGLSILQAQGLALLIELGAGPLDGHPRFQKVKSGVEAQGGWNPMLGKAGFGGRN